MDEFSAYMVLPPVKPGDGINGWGMSEMTVSERASQVDLVDQGQVQRRSLNWAMRYQRQLVVLDQSGNGCCRLIRT